MLTNQNVHMSFKPLTSNPRLAKTMKKIIIINKIIFYGVWICSLKQKFKGTIKLNITTRIRVLHICIGLKH
jgi:hypothetical protein